MEVYSKLDTKENRDKLIAVYPNLAKDIYFHINSEETIDYNCFAWAMGWNDLLVALNLPLGVDTEIEPLQKGPVKVPFCWWPTNVERKRNKEYLIKVFEAVGFEEVDNYDYEEGFDKVVLYQNDGAWTHASRIVSDKVEHSKFGTMFDAYHGRDEHLFDNNSDDAYGIRFACMRRPVTFDKDRVKPVRGKTEIHLDRMPNLHFRSVQNRALAGS